MSQEDQHEVWNPFLKPLDHMTPTERAVMERGRAWACYMNGGGGEPYHFDYPAWLKMQQHER